MRKRTKHGQIGQSIDEKEKKKLKI